MENEFYQETQENHEFASLGDYAQIEPPKEKQVPILQTLSSIATGKPSEGPVNPDKLINESYQTVAQRSIDMDKGVAQSLAVQGNVPSLRRIVEDINAQVAEVNAEHANRVKRIEEITRAAYENIVFETPGVRLNNPPEKIAKNIEKNVSNLTVGAVMETLTEKYGTIPRMIGAVVQSFTIAAATENIALADVGKEVAPQAETSRLSYTDTVNSLRSVYSNLGSEDERASFIKKLHSSLMDTYSLTGAHALTIVNDVISEEGVGAIMGPLQTASPALALLPFVGQGVKLAKGVKAINQISKIDVAAGLAQAGAKDKLVSAMAQQVRNKALVDFTKEAAGVQSLIDISNLTGSVLGKALPNAITLPAGKVQQEILNAVDETVGRLRASLKAGNIRQNEFDEFLTDIRRTYDPNIDKSIHMVHIGRMEDDPLTAAGTILRGTNEGTVFLTKEAGEEVVKLLDPSGKRGLRAVQDTANNTYALSDDTKKAIILERDAKQARLLELQAQQGKVAEKGVESSGDVEKVTYYPGSDRDLYKKGTKDLKFKEAVDYYNSEFPAFAKDPKYQKALEFLKANLPDDFVVVNKAKQPGKSGNTLGYYKRDTDKIYMATKAQSDTSTLIHEGMHALTVHRLEAGLDNPASELGKKVAEFEKLRTFVKTKIKDAPQDVQWKAKYLTKNIYEFGVGAFDFMHKTENADIAKWLDSIPYKNTTVLSRFFDLMKQVLGFSKKDTALSQWFGLSEDILSKPVDVIIGAKTFRKEPVFFGDRIIDNTEEINKLEASVELLDGRLKAAKDIEDGLSAGWLIEEKIQKSFDISQIGKLEEKDIQSMMRVSFWDQALGASDEIYKNRLVGVMVESNIRQALVNFVDKPINKLSRKEKVLLNNVLVKGDKEGKVFDSIELKGEGLSEDGMIAYYTVRKARDLSWQVKNIAASNSLTLKGLKEIWHPAIAKYKDEWGDFKLFGKVADDASILNRTALNPLTGEVERLTNNKLEQLKNQGFVVVQLDEAVPMAGVKRKHVILHSNGLKQDRIQEVIPYRTGEFSRMYTDEYFIRLKGTRIVDDAEESVNITHRTAKSMREANMYIKAYKEAAELYSVGKLDPVSASKMTGAYGWKYDELIDYLETNKGAEIVANYNRTQDDYLDTLTVFQRTFTSKRGDHIKDIQGNTTNVADPLDALAAEISNTAYMASHTEWLDVSVKRWFETAKNVLPDELKKLSPDAAFARYMQIKNPVFAGSREEAFVRNVADQIAQGMMIDTKESKLFLGAMRAITEGLDEKMNGNFVTVGSWLRQADFSSFAKTVSFHAVFGFNPVQFFVQGLNAYNATLVSPLHGLKAAKTYAMLRTALMSDNPEVWKKCAEINKFTSLGLGDADDFIRLRQAVDRTGLISNLNTSSLYGVGLGKYSITDGFWSKFSKASSFIFREGEEAARLISFDIARREWMVANPGKVWDSDDALRQILARQDALTGTMTNANAAWWQKGVVSVPMQFMQFPIKFALNIANATFGSGRKLSRAEALRMVFGNFLMFGAAGMLNKPLVYSIFGDSIQEMSEEERLLLSQGVLSWSIDAISQELTGEELKIATGERFNPMSTYVNLASAILSPTDPGLWKTLGGAPGGTFLRGWESMGAIKNLYYPEMSLSPEKLGETLKIMAQVPSVSRNYFSAERAGYLYDQMVRNGVTQYSMSDKERWFAQYLGIKPATSVDYRMLKETEKEYNKRMKDEAALITEYRIKEMEALVKGDKETATMFSNIISIRLNSLDLGDRSAVEKQVKSLSIYTDYEKSLREYTLESFNTSKKPTLVIDEKGQ